MVFIGILPKKQLIHLSLLSHIIHKLLQHSMSNDCLEVVEIMIFTSCEQFQEIYGKQHILSNIHQLLHLCMEVKSLRPLLTHSFPLYLSLPWISKKVNKLQHGVAFLYPLDNTRKPLGFLMLSRKYKKTTPGCNGLSLPVNIVQSVPHVIEKILSKDPILISFYKSRNREKYVPVAQPSLQIYIFLGRQYR